MDLDTALDIIYEQFNPSLIISKAKGEMSVEWTTCFEGKCSGAEKFDMQVCKSSCIMAAAASAATKLSAAKSGCSKASNPSTCLERISKTLEMISSKITKEKDKRAKALDKRAKYRAKVAGGV